jgi:7-cyano-7-deazaguanine synthase in queuosine biosynthesis
MKYIVTLSGGKDSQATLIWATASMKHLCIVISFYINIK